jgi:hypothetical protein
MQNRNPYSNLPANAFWRSAVVETSPYAPSEIYTKKFDITLETRIATAGSCFAQHIGSHLRRNGCNVLDLEPAPSWLPPTLHHKYGFSLYSARYGNIYTIQQLLQLTKEANNEFEPENICWERSGRYFDALRPAVEPDGLEDRDEVYFHRRHHLEKVLQVLCSMDVLIFTLGLTETWMHRKSGTLYPVAPGVIAGTFDEEEYAFVTFGFFEVQKTFDDFIDVLGRIRADRTPPKILLTVSPVPLTATASGQHVLEATTYSKSVLRAFAGQAAARDDHVSYFPAYEIATNPAARGAFFEDNLRSVRLDGVEIIMKVFFDSHNLATRYTPNRERFGVRSADPRDRSDLGDAGECEEIILETFGR